jgi:hypothetical protein
MDRERIREAVVKVAEEIKAVIQSVLAGKDLGDSQLYKDLQVDVDDIDLIRITVNDYIKYIQAGRKKGSGKGHFPPIEIIAAWCSSKGITSDNEYVLNICRRIYWHGIKEGVSPRPLFEEFEGGWEKDEDSPIKEAIDSYWDEWSDMIFDAMTEDLDEEFKK